MANVFVLVVLACASTASAAQQSEWSVPHGGLSSDENRASTGDSFTTAFLNVTYEDRDGGFVWDSNEVAKYGEGYVGPAYGYIVHVGSKSDPDEHTGCSWPLTDSSAEDGRLPIPGTKWIALIKRGKCNFELKVSNAYRSNASGVIIYNDRDAAQLDKMKLSTDRQRNMSAVFTYKWKGEELAKMVNDGYSVTVYISVASHCTRTYNNINRTSVLFVSISFIVLMIISLAWLVFYYIQRFRYIHAKDRLSKRLCCAAKKALSKIPVKNLKSEDKEVQGDGECCAVCIEPYKVSDLLRVLPCRHDFHKSCIDPWLLEHRTCPMCKMDILKYYGFVFTGSQESILQLDVEDGRASRTTARALSPPPRVLHGRGLATDNSFEIPDSQRSSRASSPDEMTPSLRGTPQSQTQQNSLGGLPRSEASTPSLHQSPTRQIVCEVSPDRKVPLRDTNSSDERRD